MNDVPGMRQKQVPTNRENPEDCQTTRGLTTQGQSPILQTTRRSEPKATRDPVWSRSRPSGSGSEETRQDPARSEAQRARRDPAWSKAQSGQSSKRPDRPDVVRGQRAWENTDGAGLPS